MTAIKRALISVSDKKGIVKFASALNDAGIEIISTGGTFSELKSANIDVKDVSSVTNFPEILDGRVKTLHPKIHAGILHDRSNKKHSKEMNKQKFPSLDLIIVNFYPFDLRNSRATIFEINICFLKSVYLTPLSKLISQFLPIRVLISFDLIILIFSHILKCSIIEHYEKLSRSF